MRRDLDSPASVTDDHASAVGRVAFVVDRLLGRRRFLVSVQVFVYNQYRPRTHHGGDCMTSPPSAHPQPVTNDDLDAIERAVTESLWRAKSYADLGVEEPSDAYTDATLDEIDNVLVPAVMESVTPLIDEIRTLRAAIRDYIDGAVPDDDPALCPHCGAGDCYSDATGTIRCTQVNRAVFLDEDGRYRHLRKHLPDTAKWSALGGGE